MPVNSQHFDYLGSLSGWLRARDVLAGEDAIKAAGERYLPRLDSQTDEEFSAYVKRASFFNATARTAEAYLGLIFRRSPFVKLPHVSAGVGRALAGFQNDADMLGTTLTGYSKLVVGDVVGLGRAGTLVDWAEGGATGHRERRAYVVFYRAEQIINWRVERVNGRNVPTLIVLSETAARRQASNQSSVISNQRGEGKPTANGADSRRRLRRPSEGAGLGTGPQWGSAEVADPFEAELVEQMRVLRLDEAGDGRWQYSVEVWQALPERSARGRRRGRQWQLLETRIPLRLGKPLPLIPFVFHGPRHSRPDVDRGPLEDIVAVNLDHYRLNADFKHGLHFTALPTAWVSGFDKTSTLRIGSSTAWVAETPGATAGFLEFTGQGLTTFERTMDRDERLMAVLGSRLLEDRKKVGDPALAARLKAAA